MAVLIPFYGLMSAANLCRDNPAVCQEVENKVRAIYGLGGSAAEEEEQAGDKPVKGEKTAKKTKTELPADSTESL